MPLQIIPYQQQTTVQQVGRPRVSAPMLVDPMGQALTEVAGAAARIGVQHYQAQREADLQDRVGKATTELAQLEFSLERDQDFRTANQRFKEGSDAIRDKYLDGVTDQAVATTFRKQYNQHSLAKSLSVQAAVFSKEKDYTVATLDQNIDTYATQSAQAGNPAAGALAEQQARLAIATAQTGGWISAEEAGKRERQFLNKRDSAVVIRDIGMSPMLTATKLSIDPTYAQNVDPVQRERYADQAFRRAQAEETRLDAQAKAERKALGDDLLKEALNRQNAGMLTSAFVEQIRYHVEPNEYKSLLAGLSGVEVKDEPQAYATLQGLIYSNPAEAEQQAFVLHRNKRISNATLSSTLTRAREIGRQEGPRTEYERSRLFITDTLKPSPLVNDPAGSARFAIAVREYDDYSLGGQRTDRELREKADEIQKRYSLVDMADLARRTAAGAQPTPEMQLKSIGEEALKLMADRDAKKITPQEFNKKMERLNRTRMAAEKAAKANGGK